MEKSENTVSENDLPTSITWTLLRFINRVQVGRSFPRDDGKGGALTLIEAETCLLIRHGNGLAAIEIADKLGVTRSAVSQVLSRLRSKGYIFEQPDPLNAKRKQLHLTKLGEQASEAGNEYEKMMREMLYDVPEKELQSYHRFVEKLEQFHKSIRLQSTQDTQPVAKNRSQRQTKTGGSVRKSVAAGAGARKKESA